MAKRVTDKPISIRMPQFLRERIAAAADGNLRSQNKEILYRLVNSFRDEASLSADKKVA